MLVFHTIRSTAIPLDGRDDRHALGVGLGLAHRVLGAVAADLEDLEVRLGRFALEGVGRLQLIQGRDGLLDGEVVLLGLNSRQQLVLGGLELGARERALGEQDLAIVARPGGALAGVLLLDLLIEVVQLGAPVEGVGELRLAVELDEEVTLRDRRAGLDELGDDERLRVGTREPRRRDGRRLDRLDRAAQSDRPDEVLAL